MRRRGAGRPAPTSSKGAGSSGLRRGLASGGEEAFTGGSSDFCLPLVRHPVGGKRRFNTILCCNLQEIVRVVMSKSRMPRRAAMSEPHSHPDWRDAGIRIVKSQDLDTNTPQTAGMSRAAAINFAKAGAKKLWA